MNKYFFGVDVGGTTVKLGLFDSVGHLLDKWEIVSNTDNNGEAILPDVANSIFSKLEERNILRSDVVGVGVGVPGAVDIEGTVNVAVNLGWGVMSIKNILSELLLGIPVEAANDANVAALGEMWKGGGIGYRNLVTVTLGTGVGGGIIIEGKILTGYNGAAGELGHIRVNYEETEACNCGNKGCLEQYASATGIVRIAKKQLESSKEDSILRDKEVTAKAVFDAVKENDLLALEIAEEFGECLGNALAAIAGVVNPEVFVIGGGVSKAGNILLTFIEKYYKESVFFGSSKTKFALATLGNDAGIYGAARMILD